MPISSLKKCFLALLFSPLLLAAGCKQESSYTPFPSYPNIQLVVASSTPASGVTITASPADNNGVTSGSSIYVLTYKSGTSAVLTAPSLSGTASFTSWTGCTSTSGTVCNITATANTTVTANYTAAPVLTVTSSNPTSGVTISASPNDVNGAGAGRPSFTRTYVSGTAVTLVAPATAGGNNFGSWTGCTTVSTTTCNVTLTSSRTVTANYVTPATVFGLTVNSTNPSSGVSISASPADNNAKATITTSGSLAYNSGTIVTLTAPTTSGSQVFQSWSGCTTATALTCTVNLTAATSVTANYYVAPVGNTYYVSPLGSDSNTGTSIAQAFLTLQKAANTTAPGDVVYALTGSYTGATVTSTVLSINTPGTSTAPIAYRAYPGNTPTINFSSFTGVGFGNNAAYIELNGFTINGDNQNVTYAQASTADAIANPGNYPQFNGNCVFANNRTTTGNHPNHLSILNNIISNCGAGIGFNGVDYVTITGNTVFNCNWYDAYGTSAISLNGSYNTDNTTGYKQIITGNRIYNNYELIPYHVTNPLKISDGEGIIIDTNQNSSIAGSGLTYPAYTGRTLIANNVIYNNGSSAIEVFQSSHVDVVNNSTYGNMHTSATTGYATPTGRGELALATASDVNAYNNILYSYNSQNPVVQTNCISCTSDYNLFYNGTNTGYTSGPNDVYANPLYVDATDSNLTIVNLGLMVGSPGIDTGTSTLAPGTDFLGNPRPRGKGYDRGAYEQ